MDEKIKAVAKMLEIDTEALFVRAWRADGGLIFGLRPPAEVHERWKKGRCTAPPYVRKFVDRLAATIH